MAIFRSPVTLPLHPNDWVRPAGNRDFRVTSPFGPRSDGFHGALDIGNGRIGDDVVAVGPGIVIAAGYLTHPWSQATLKFPTGNYGGLMVVVQHQHQVVSIYAHLMNRGVNVNQSLISGQRIGAVGESGSAQGQGHLHFGMQAPSPIPGVASHESAYGIGLDVDPWPLINGLIPDTALPPEDDVKIKGAFTSHVINRRTVLAVDAHFRAGVVEGDDLSLAVFPKGTAVIPTVAVKGRSIAGNADWLGGWLYVDKLGWSYGYFHSSVLAEGTAIEQSGFTAAEVEAARATGTAAGFADAKTKARVAVEGIKP